jgi:hypothetical protein
MRSLPFDQPGRFWRGNLHTHSTASDGLLTPQQVCQTYHQAGYDFLAITDHFLERYHWPITSVQELRTAQFTALTGAELHSGHTETGSLWHILAVGLPLDFAPARPNETGPDIATRAMGTGAFVAVAHPAWYSLTERDVLSLGFVHAIEVFNGTSADHSDKVDSWYMLDLMLNRGRRYFALATDDAHFNPRRHDSFTGWTMVKSTSNDPEALLQALKDGRYYSSTGPELHNVTVNPATMTVTVDCSPVSHIFVTGKQNLARMEFGDGITRAEFKLENFETPFIRVTVRTADGKRAWTNPIWLE